MRPLADFVILRPVEMEEKSSGGVYLSETTRRKSNEAQVVAVGPGPMEGGARAPINLKPGDRVLFLRFGYGLTVGGENLYAVRDHDILLVLDESERATFVGHSIDQYEREELLGKE